ncbi:hypothetical protein QM012_000297 [Aureobasidium pullulans]|uniref:Uncharacterized protein n=1 Tax=Aureobasidium pullulans TaxID=5580 RepID=A0ABR0TW04_AURPU
MNNPLSAFKDEEVMLADGKQRNTTPLSEMTEWREKGMMVKNGLGQGRGSWD